MDYLSENRYQLLFIDDDELMTDGNDAVEPVAGQQQQPQQQQQSKNKRNKNKNVIKPILEEKQSQQQQQTPRAVPQQQPQQQQQPKQPQQQPQEQPKQQPQEQVQQQLDQQPKEQPKQQSQQQPEQQQPQQQQPQFRYRQRIINNSNRYAGAGFGVGAAAYRGNSTRYAKTNNNTNNNNNLETDEGDGNNTQVVDDRKFITVEQWKAMRGERVKPIYNIRKPGEGEPNKKADWKHMTVLQKNKDNNYNNDNNKSKLSEGNQKGSEEDNGLDYDASMYPQRVGRLQRIVDIEFKFKDDRRRSGAYRSGWMVSRPLNDNAVQQRTANEAQPSLTQVAINNNDFETASDQINMNDEAEFPTLG